MGSYTMNMELTGSSTVRSREIDRQLELKDEYSKIKLNIFAILKLGIIRITMPCPLFRVVTIYFETAEPRGINYPATEMKTLLLLFIII